MKHFVVRNIAFFILIIYLLMGMSLAFADTVYNIDWFSAKESAEVFAAINFVAGENAVLTDLNTEISLSVRILSLGNHLDVEPQSALDAAKMCEIYGVSHSEEIVSAKHYKRRPMLLTTSKGYTFACSMYGVPHGVNTVLDNDFPGSFCLHFLNSKTSGTQKIDKAHQEAIQTAIDIAIHQYGKAVKTVRSGIDLENDNSITGIILTTKDAQIRELPSDTSDVISTCKAREIFAYTYRVNDWYKLWNSEQYINVNDGVDITQYYIEPIYSTAYRFGDNGDMVAWIQTALQRLGYYTGEINGIYNVDTVDAVCRFELDNGLVDDGITGEKVIKCIQKKLFRHDEDSFILNSKVYNLNWSASKNDNKLSSFGLRAGNSGKLFDLRTNSSFNVSFLSSGNHLDVEPISVADTSIALEIYSGRSSFDTFNKLSKSMSYARPMVLKTSDGLQFICVMLPHKYSEQTILDNLFEGHFCLYFLNSTLSDNEQISDEYIAILNEAQHIVENDYNSTVLTIPDNGVPIIGNYFPDNNFRNHISSFDLDSDGFLNNEEIDKITELWLSFLPIVGLPITSIKGIEYFSQLKILYARDCSLTDIDVSFNRELEELYVSSNQLKNLDVTKNIKLKRLECDHNQLTELNISACGELEVIFCNHNNLSSLDVSQNSALDYLCCDYNPIKELDVSKVLDLGALDCNYCQIESLDVSQNNKLTALCAYANLLTSIDVSNNPELKELDVGKNNIHDINVSQNLNLHMLVCGSNEITNIDVSQNLELYRLDCNDNDLITLNITNNSKLGWLNCADNKLSVLDVSNNPFLEFLDCSNNLLTELNLDNQSEFWYFFCDGNHLTNIDLTHIKIDDNSGSDFSIIGNTYTIADSIFDLSTLPGSFDVSKAFDWQGGTVEGTILTATENIVTYKYECGNGFIVRFTLLIGNEISIITDELTEVPVGLNYTTVEDLKTALASILLQVDSGLTVGNFKTYDVKMMISHNGGQTWIEATEDNFPIEGIDVVIPYPTGTNSAYTFYAVHMFTVTSTRLGTIAGNTEIPEVTAMVDGLHMKLKGFSPVALAWKVPDDSSSSSNIEFHVRVLWQVGSDHPKAKVRFYKNDIVGDHYLIETKETNDEWIYSAYSLSPGSVYYALVDADGGYYIEYVNQDQNIKDKLYDGGTAIIRYLPPTGDSSSPLLYGIVAITALVGVALLMKRK